MDLHLVTRFALFGNEVDDLLDLLILHQRACARMGLGAPGLISMSPLPSSFSAPISSRITRLSILDATWKAIRLGMFALITR